jgi:pimeloyl-ACP methyl ester carboxylesterase
MHQVLPDFEDFDEIVHSYGEGTTLARLAWDTQYDLKLEQRLQRVNCPSLVVRAEHDRLIPDEMAERYAGLLPDSRIETIPGTGHALAVEQPEKVGAAIGGFIEGVSR